VKLSELVSVRKGRKPEAVVAAPLPGYRRLIQIDDLRPDASLKFCPPARDEVIAEPRDVIIAWDGANAATSGFGLSGVIGSTLALLRPVHDDVHTPYLGYFLRAQQAYLRERCKGATVPHIDARVLGALQVPLPLLPEQRRVAELLERADALRAMRRGALEKVEELTESIFLDLFGDLEGAGWPMSTIRDVAHPGPGTIRTGPFGSQLLHSEFVDHGVAVLGIDNVVSNEFRWGERRYISVDKYGQLKRYTVAPGDVLITIMGTLGRCAIVPDDIPVAINTKHLCCITLDARKCLPAFLHSYFLRHPLARRYLERAAKGAIMAGLNMEIIKAMPIPLAPVALQQEFADRVAAIEQLKAAQHASLDTLDSLYASLEGRAFRSEP
jgi:type I restriction enzyme S subunit